VAKPILCPSGHDGPFELAEAGTVYREVLSSDSDGIVAASEWDSDDFAETPGVPLRLRCTECNAEFPVPDGVDVDYE